MERSTKRSRANLVLGPKKHAERPLADCKLCLRRAASMYKQKYRSKEFIGHTILLCQVIASMGTTYVLEQVLARLLCYHMHEVVHSGYFPAAWIVARFPSLYKKEDRSNPIIIASLLIVRFCVAFCLGWRVLLLTRWCQQDFRLSSLDVFLAASNRNSYCAILQSNSNAGVLAKRGKRFAFTDLQHAAVWTGRHCGITCSMSLVSHPNVSCHS
jgi:hypothetical protein